MIATQDGLASTPQPLLPPSTRSERDRIEIFETFLKPLRPGRMLDLATGHGKFAIAAQRLGWDVTGVDARTVRMPTVSGINWVQADIRDYPIEGFDLITLFGILYHLELDDILKVLRRAAGTMTMIDTHFVTRPTVVQQGYEGHLFREVRSEPTASVDNEYSFWPHQSTLLRILIDCGFADIYELRPSYHPNRTFYICH